MGAPPCGFSRNALLGVYFIVNCLIGNMMVAADPLQEMLVRRGAFPHLLDRQEAMFAVKKVLGFGISLSVLVGAVAGIFLDFVGPKITALIGAVLQGVGFLLLFYGSPTIMYLGTTAIAFAFQFSFNSHLAVSTLFPGNTSLALAVMGAGPDIALYVPVVMNSIALRLGVGKEGLVIVGYCACILVPIFISDLFLMPLHPFVTPTTNTEEEVSLLAAETGEAPQKARAHAIVGRPKYWSMGTLGQICNIHYLTFAPFFVFHFCRKKHMAQNIRDTFTDIFGSPEKGAYWTGWFNACSPFGFIPSIVWGAVVDVVGVPTSMFLFNGVGAIFLATSLVPNGVMAATTIFFYVCNASYVYGMLFAFLASSFGFAHIATLQGIQSTLAGLGSLAADQWWRSYLAVMCGGSMKTLNVHLLVATCVMFVVPILNWFWRPSLADGERSRKNTRLTISQQVCNRASLKVMADEVNAE